MTPALANDIEGLQEELATVRKNVAWIRGQFQEDVDISGLAQSIFDELEPLPSVQEPIQVPDGVQMDADTYRRHLRAKAVIDPDGAGTPSPQTASALAERHDVSPRRIEDAIEYLEDQFLPVTAVEYDGKRHYFRED